MWESNPPRTGPPPATGFEVQEAHRDLSAPEPESRRIGPELVAAAYSALSICFLNSALGMAPTMRCTGLPSLKSSSVGMLIIP